MVVSRGARRLVLLGSVVLTLLVPLLGSLVRFGDLPPGFGEFPPRQVALERPGFSPVVFWIGVAIEIPVFLFLIVPRIFGFVKAPKRPLQHRRTRRRFPPWFWGGLVAFVGSWIILWGRIPVLDVLDPFMTVPLWWGFTFMLDGIVFYRSGGQSLRVRRPGMLALLAVVSCVGWFMYEYLDYAVLGNWYYPNQVLSPYGTIAWFLACYTGIFPQLFEIVDLFRTIPGFAERYSRGPRLRPGRLAYGCILALGLVLSFLMGLFPNECFVVLWVAPVLILWGTLGLCGVRTIFSSLEEGDWSLICLSGIAMIVSGLGWELVNFGSEYFLNSRSMNPSYWRYDIPYVGDVHFPFSQMPLLGYLGYLPYAWMCYLQWTLAARLFHFNGNAGHPCPAPSPEPAMAGVQKIHRVRLGEREPDEVAGRSPRAGDKV